MSALFALAPDGDQRPDPEHLATNEPTAVGPTSLYRKYRPQSFDAAELVGQAVIVRTLRNALRLDRVAHAYLFCGPRGTGKTTTARVLAKAVNCLDPEPDRRPCNVCASCRAITLGATTDVVEIDAASNRGIDDIRDLRERAKYAPSQLRTKFYIVDEAHQITGAAANAFLKTLEEPPAHAKFVLATTDPEELLPTIVSRCQRFDFRRIGAEVMADRLRAVAGAETITIDDDALAAIARHAGGSLRDALGLLDQLSLYQSAATDDPEPDPIRAETVLELLGVGRNDDIGALAVALAERDPSAALAVVNRAIEAGVDARALNRQLVAYLRLLLHERAGGSPDADATARELASRFDLGTLADLARRFGEIDAKIKHAPFPQLPLEVALVEAALGNVGPAAAAPAPAQRAERPLAVPSPSAELDDEPPRALPTNRPLGPSLRERVRGASPSPATSTSTPSPTPIRPRPDRTADDPPVDDAGNAEIAAPARAASLTIVPTDPGDGGGEIDVERLADLWPRIRQDVKAVNRRIEALLSSVDPVAVSGAEVTLASAYEFHRDKLNSDDVRAVVEGVLGRLLGRPVHVSCVLRGEGTPAPPATTPSPFPSLPPPDDLSPFDQGSAEPPPAIVPNAELGELDEQRLRAAKNIFDAEEIDPAPSSP